MSIMSFADKQLLSGALTEQALLRLSWEAEIFGVGMFETLADMYPGRAGVLTACARMEWFNVHYCEPLGHDAGAHVSLERTEALARAGAALGRNLRTFERVAKLMVLEAPVALALYRQLGKRADSAALKALATDLDEHESALRDWFQSELDGASDGGEKIYAYLARHGVTREDAMTPRRLREGLGGDQQRLVLAFFPNEGAADRAARALRNWDLSNDRIDLDAIGMLARDESGAIKQHKLGARASKKGMGIGLLLGIVAAIPTAGLSVVGGVLGGGLVGMFVRKGLKMSSEEAARIDRELASGHVAVGTLTWQFQTKLVETQLAALGGTLQTHELALLDEPLPAYVAHAPA